MTTLSIWLRVNLWHYQEYYVLGCDTMQSCSHSSFTGTRCFHLQGKRTKHLQTSRHRQLISVKCQWLSSRLHGFTLTLNPEDSPAKWVQTSQRQQQTDTIWQSHIPEARNLKTRVFWRVPVLRSVQNTLPLPPYSHFYLEDGGIAL